MVNLRYWLDELDGVTYLDLDSHVGLFSLMELAKADLSEKEYESMVSRVLDIRDISKAILIINEYMPYPFKVVS